METDKQGCDHVNSGSALACRQLGGESVC